ncbi:MAG: nucleotide exchange factor GrpE [Bacilli bacterium]|nr:nucleotide exchange factor GrpE [Bacilli bacterium]
MSENNRYRFEEEEKGLNKEKKEQKEDKEIRKENDSLKPNKNDKQYKKMQNKINALNEEIDELKKELEKAKNDVLLAKAEEVNFKKRVDADKNQMIEYANQKILEKMITQLDMFDKVVSMPTEDPVLKNYLLGFQMINNNLKQVLEEEGVKKIECKLYEKLDPKYQHALQTAWDENYEEDVILQELQTGYLYKGRILRPTLVKVNKKEGK